MKMFNLFLITVLSCLTNLSAAQIERSYFEVEDNIELEGFFHMPLDTNLIKGVVLVVGGSGFTKGGFGGPAGLAKKLADSGYISFEWNKRGLRTNQSFTSVEMSKIYESADIDNIYSDAVGAMDHVTGIYPNLPLYVVGGSEGSIITTLLAESFPDKIKAAASFGTVVSHFVDTLTHQISDELVTNTFSYDNDHNGKMDIDEIKYAMSKDKKVKSLFVQLRKSYIDLDLSYDKKISKDELSFAIGDKFLINSPGYFMKTSGLPDSYLTSMFRLIPLYNRVQNIHIPVAFFQGEDDWNTPVDKVMELELVTKVYKMKNFLFRYYPNTAHKPSDKMLNDIIRYLNIHN